jgi:phage gpG-like protein
MAEKKNLMSEPRISINIKGIEDVEKKLIAMELRSTNFAPVFTKAKVELSAASASNFALGGLPSGGWSPLSPSYAAWKMIRFPGAPPLVRTGRLAASLSGNTVDSVFSVTPTKMQIGTRLEYAKFHQYGTSKMPKRKIVFEPTGFAKSVGSSSASWIAKGEIL